MQPFTLDSHLTYGYGTGVFNHLEKSNANQLWCDYAPALRQPGTFRQECVAAARLLYKQAQELGREVYVMLSGGLDSEVVVKAFMEAGVPFKTITYRFKRGLNAHELTYVEQFKYRHAIHHQYFDIDIEEWAFSQELEDWFLSARSASMGFMPHCKLMHHIWTNMNGLPVLGNGDLFLSKAHDWAYIEMECVLVWYRFAVQHGILGGIGFFQHTSELVLAMMRERRIQELAARKNAVAEASANSSRRTKYAVFRAHWPDLTFRLKYDGKELVKPMFRQRNDELLENRDDYYNDAWVVPFEYLIERLNPEPQLDLSQLKQPYLELQTKVKVGT